MWYRISEESITTQNMRADTDINGEEHKCDANLQLAAARNHPRETCAGNILAPGYVQISEIGAGIGQDGTDVVGHVRQPRYIKTIECMIHTSTYGETRKRSR
jgi:hypothetical protein